jgi:predicted secreted hydrolase
VAAGPPAAGSKEDTDGAIPLQNSSFSQKTPPAGGRAHPHGPVRVTLGTLAQTAKASTPVVSLPQDESPHPSASTEWWYFTGRLTGTDIFGKSHSYGFELIFVRSNVLNLEPTVALYNGQFAITDLTRGIFDQFTLNDSVQADNVPAQGGYNTTVNTWNINGVNGKNHISAFDANYALNLELYQSTPAALHGNGGLIPYGPFGSSYYYSETNLKVSGTVDDHGIPVTVTGLGWQDHQWGDFKAGPGAWTWFALQLSNHTQYMLYFIKDASGNLVQVVATKVNADGTTEAIPPDEVSETPIGSWTSPATGITYPQNWLVTVPGGQLTVAALEPGQEVANLSVQDYREGDALVTGTINGQAVTCQSYAEVQPPFSVLQPGGIGSIF